MLSVSCVAVVMGNYLWYTGGVENESFYYFFLKIPRNAGEQTPAFCQSELNIVKTNDGITLCSSRS